MRMRGKVQADKFREDFLAGTELIINLSGTTFKSTLHPKSTRGDLIGLLADEADGVMAVRVNEPENKYDKYRAATRVDIIKDDVAFDLGYIPVNATITYKDSEGDFWTYISRRFNAVIYKLDYNIEIVRMGVSETCPWVTVKLTIA